MAEKAEKKKEVNAYNVGFTKENNPDDMIQRTLIIFKPDAVQRGIVGEILSRFERVGLKIVATKMVNPDKDKYLSHYVSKYGGTYSRDNSGYRNRDLCNKWY